MIRLLKMFSLLLLAGTQLRSAPEPRAGVLALNGDGVIPPVVVDMLDSAIAQAQREQAQILLIRLNTPGGFAEATRIAVEKIVSAPIPVVVWVGPAGARAASAGFFLLEAADVAALAAGTKKGHAHPVTPAGHPLPALISKIAHVDC